MTDIDPNLRKAPKGAKIIDFEDDDFDQYDEQPTAPPKKSNNHVNPLQKHFRVPGVSIRLPSGLYYYENGEVEASINGEIDVYPMTTGDELLLKNPDALMNGRAIEMLIQSCVPQVNNVRALISQDLDVILLAIRAISSGSNSRIETNCPKCNAENLFEFNALSVLDTIVQLQVPYLVKINNELTAEVRPYNFFEQTKASITAFEEGKKSQHALRMQKAGENIDEAAITAMVTESMNKIIKVKHSLMANSIIRMITANEEVTKKEHIIEFLENAPKSLVNKIVEAIEKINNLPSYNNKMHGTCISCEHQWDIDIDFNPSNFFE